MFLKVLRYGLYGSVLTSGIVLNVDAYQNNGLNSYGLVRFGRATVAVNYFYFANKIYVNLCH